MYADFTNVKNWRRSIHYNERKVGRGDAILIHAGNFLQETESLSLADKIGRFAHLHALNTRVEGYARHISLNFGQQEQLNKDLLVDITREYMDRTGLGEQPYLAYQHKDVAHDHLHIVASLIKPDGAPLRDYKTVTAISMLACRHLEEKYGLEKVTAKPKNQPIKVTEELVMAQSYGKAPTARYMAGVLENVLGNYLYTSLPELNAILRLYNIQADAGKPGGNLQLHKGLLYKMLNEEGKPVGVPIKASDFYINPGLKLLERKFLENKEKRTPLLDDLRTRIDWSLFGNPADWQEWVKCLEKERVRVIPSMDKQGGIQEIGFLDLQQRISISGEELGENYRLQSLRDKIGRGQSKSLEEGLTLRLPKEDRRQKRSL